MPERPLWLRECGEDKLNQWYDRMPLLLEKGRIVLGHIVQANELLFRRGKQDCPFQAIYTMDAYYYDDLEAWQALALRIYDWKQKEKVPAYAERISSALKNEIERVFAWKIPEEETEKRPVYFTTLMGIREHLPGKKLKDGIVPLLVFQEGEQADAMYLPKWYH